MTAKELKVYRVILGLKQEDIAAELGITRRTYIKYELEQSAIPLSVETYIKLKCSENGIIFNSQNVNGNNPSEQLYDTTIPNLNNKQMSTTVLTTAASVSVVLDLVAELVAQGTSETIDQVKDRARKLMLSKSRMYDDFLANLI